VTADLKTTNNELSFWAAASNDDAELHETVLALATGGDRLDKMDIAWSTRQSFADANLSVQESPDHANTPVESLKPRHVDVTKLDLVRLGCVATVIHDAINAEQIRRFHPKEVLAVLVKAVTDERLAVDALRGQLQEKVRAALAKEQ
jgi:hypothetical protein